MFVEEVAGGVAVSVRFDAEAARELEGAVKCVEAKGGGGAAVARDNARIMDGMCWASSKEAPRKSSEASRGMHTAHTPSVGPHKTTSSSSCLLLLLLLSPLLFSESSLLPASLSALVDVSVPLALLIMARSTKDATSSIMAAQQMSWPRGWSSKPASPINFVAMPRHKISGSVSELNEKI